MEPMLESMRTKVEWAGAWFVPRSALYVLAEQLTIVKRALKETT